MGKEKFRAKTWSRVLVAPYITEEDFNLIHERVKYSQIKTEKLSVYKLFAFKLSSSGRAICTVKGDSLIVLAVDHEHKYNLESINRNVAVEEFKVIECSLSGVIDNAMPIIYNAQQKATKLELKKDNTKKLEWNILGGMPGSGKTTIGLDILTSYAKEDPDGKYFYITKEQRLLEVAKNKCKNIIKLH